MRHLLLALLVAMLPLRGWVGDAMATGMLTQHISAVQTAPQGTQAKPTTDCHGHAASAEEQDGTQHNCATCNLCHSVASAPVLAHWQPACVPAHLPTTGKRSYTSADTVAGLKPPIS